MSGWSKRDLALVLGLRALGDDYDKIAYRLNRDIDDVRSVVVKARCLFRAEGWLCKLLDRHDNSNKLPADPPQIKVWLPRKFRVVPVALQVRPPSSNELTAHLMGDPPPGRSALDHLNRQPTAKEMNHGHRRSDH